MTELLCPRCGKGGLVKDGRNDGKPRWCHAGIPKNRECKWRGEAAVGRDEAASKGVDRAGAEALHATIKGAKRARYVITAAQNATPVNKPFFASLLRYCAERDAQLIVVPYRYKNPCLAPETRVLTADLRWVPVGTLVVGETLVGFDENSAAGRGKGRSYKVATVTATGRAMMPSYRVVFDDGTEIIASENHPWLSDEGRHVWRTTKNLVHQKGYARIVRLFDVWDEPKSRESGYIAAAFDGEGSLIQQPDGRSGWQTHLTYTQKPNAMSAEVERCTAASGIKLTASPLKNGVGSWHVLGGRPEILRTLGQHRPHRLLKKLDIDRLGRVQALRTQRVVALESVGMREVVTLETSSATFIAEGLATHNTSMWSQAAKDDDWWAPELAKYLLDIRVDLNPNLTLMADIKTQPTANSPLQGFETLTGPKSAIIGHPKLELSTVPTPQSKMAKILTTTGAVTQKNYLNSKAGKKGEHHHTFGACVVEVDGKRFHLRQLNAVRDGSFIDLDTEYSGKAIRKVRAAGLVMGDTHVEFVDPSVVKATFGAGGMVAALKPEALVYHDVCDFFSRNHHHRGEVFVNIAKYKAGRDSVERELDRTFAFVDKHLPPNSRNIFVPSNHPDALARWVKETDPRSDPENCLIWAETFQAMAKAAKMTRAGSRTIDPFIYWAKRKMKTAKRTVFLHRDESYLIKGIEVGFHGDAGPNGSRGTRTGFTRIGAKTVIGHSHSPGIKDGCYQVGTSSYMGLEYQRGPSSWMHAHCLIYRNSKRSLVFIIDGEWHA